MHRTKSAWPGKSAEYEITENIESCFRKFLEFLGKALRGVNVPGSRHMVPAFRKRKKLRLPCYLGAAFRPRIKVHGKLFLDLLCKGSPVTKSRPCYGQFPNKHPTAVIMLDLGAEQSWWRIPPPPCPRSCIGRCCSGAGVFQRKKDRAVGIHPGKNAASTISLRKSREKSRSRVG